MARLVEQMVLFDDDTITAVLLWLDSRRCLYIATNVVTLVQLKAYNLVQAIDEIKFKVASSFFYASQHRFKKKKTERDN